MTWRYSFCKLAFPVYGGCMLTQERLKNTLHYNPTSGQFTRLNRVGNIAGTVGYQGYTAIHVNGRIYQAHRLAWLYVYGRFPTADLDHINDNKSDNRIENLRETTRSQNMLATPKPRNNTSGYKGVSFDKSRNKWEAYCTISRKRKHLGRFDTAEQAHQAYKTYVLAHQPEYYHE